LVGLIRDGDRGGSYQISNFGPQWVVGLLGLYAVMAVVIVLLKGHGLNQGPGGSISLRVAEISPRSVAIALGGLIIVASGAITTCAWRTPMATLMMGAVVGVGAVVLVLTGSRIALIGTVLGLIPVFIGWLSGQTRMTIRWKPVAGVLVVGGVIAVLAGVSWFSGLIDPTAVDLRAARALDWDAGGGRFEMWSTALRLISDWEWLLGVGVPNWREFFGHPHSFFVSALLYYGIPGLVFILGGLISLAYQAWSSRSPAGLGIAVYLIIVFSTSGFPDRPEFWVVYALGFLAIVVTQRTVGCGRSLEGSAS